MLLTLPLCVLYGSQNNNSPFLVKRVSVKTVVNTTKEFISSVGGVLVVTTCFGHQVAIFRLYKYEEKNV
jgi:hypothetical protein